MNGQQLGLKDKADVRNVWQNLRRVYSVVQIDKDKRRAPLLTTWVGKPQILTSPTVEPTAAIINPKRDLNSP